MLLTKNYANNLIYKHFLNKILFKNQQYYIMVNLSKNQIINTFTVHFICHFSAVWLLKWLINQTLVSLSFHLVYQLQIRNISKSLCAVDSIMFCIEIQDRISEIQKNDFTLESTWIWRWTWFQHKSQLFLFLVCFFFLSVCFYTWNVDLYSDTVVLSQCIKPVCNLFIIYHIYILL